MNKLSICTVCMNRLIHLRNTLPANIIDNENHPNIEFAVLDYNSQDGMEEWVRSNMMKYIESGILKYYKTYEPKYFDLSHSKNMISVLSTGDIICLVDADNYAGKGYADWISSVYSAHGNNTIITTLRKTHIPLRDQGGKLCFSRDLYNAVRGFDETLIGYGIDDVDLVNRLEKAGGKRVFIENEKFLKYIGHTNEARLINHHLINNLENIYLQKTDFRNVTNRALYLLKDDTFLYVNYEFDKGLVSNNILTFSGWKIAKNGHGKGSIERSKEGLVLQFEDKARMLCEPKDHGAFISAADQENTFWDDIPKKHEMFYTLVMGYGECMNRLKYLENDKNSGSVNSGGYGKGTVYLNLDTSHPIDLGYMIKA